MKHQILAIALVSAIVSTAFAHGGMDHILGVISKINGDIVVVTKEGKDTTVYLRDFTKYELGSKPSKRVELRVGDRVVIHAKRNGNNEEAYEVHFMHPSSK